MVSHGRMEELIANNRPTNPIANWQTCAHCPNCTLPADPGFVLCDLCYVEDPTPHNPSWSSCDGCAVVSADDDSGGDHGQPGALFVTEHVTFTWKREMGENAKPHELKSLLSSTMTFEAKCPTCNMVHEADKWEELVQCFSTQQSKIVCVRCNA